MRLRRALGAALLAAMLLAGCQPTASSSVLRDGTSHDMHRNTLMDAAFGAGSQMVLPGEVYWQAEIALPDLLVKPLPADPAQTASASVRNRSSVVPRAVAVRPREVVRISESQLAMVIESVPREWLAQDGQQQPERMPVYLGLIFYGNDAPTASNKHKNASGGMMLKLQNADSAETMAWRPLRLDAFVDAMLVGKERPEVQVYKLASDRYLLTYVQRVCRQGYCGQWLKGYLLQPDVMTEVMHMRLSGSNAYAYESCPNRLEGDVPAAGSAKETVSVAEMIDELYAQSSNTDQAPPTPQTASAAKPRPSRAQGNAKNAAGGSCYAIRGEIHPISRGADTADVSVRFTGLVSEGNGQRRTIGQNQLFRLHGQRLVQIEGLENPLPSPELLP
ncbi:MAG: hypothetical protein Q4G39_04235 [Brachymonas sp.]|nr:hypothetical protein [Brachymonas sp.]